MDGEFSAQKIARQKNRSDEPALDYIKKKELELYKNPVSLKWKNVNDARKEIFAKEEGEKR